MVFLFNVLHLNVNALLDTINVFKAVEDKRQYIALKAIAGQRYVTFTSNIQNHVAQVTFDMPLALDEVNADFSAEISAQCFRNIIEHFTPHRHIAITLDSTTDMLEFHAVQVHVADLISGNYVQRIEGCTQYKLPTKPLQIPALFDFDGKPEALSDFTVKSNDALLLKQLRNLTKFTPRFRNSAFTIEADVGGSLSAYAWFTSVSLTSQESDSHAPGMAVLSPEGLRILHELIENFAKLDDTSIKVSLSDRFVYFTSGLFQVRISAMERSDSPVRPKPSLSTSSVKIPSTLLRQRLHSVDVAYESSRDLVLIHVTPSNEMMIEFNDFAEAKTTLPVESDTQEMLTAIVSRPLLADGIKLFQEHDKIVLSGLEDPSGYIELTHEAGKHFVIAHKRVSRGDLSLK